MVARSVLEEPRDALPERRAAAENELVPVDDVVLERWGDSVDLDLAGTADRRGIGGPSPSDQHEQTPS